MVEGGRVVVRWALGGRLDELWVEVWACRMGREEGRCVVYGRVGARRASRDVHSADKLTWMYIRAHVLRIIAIDLGRGSWVCSSSP